MDAYGIICVYLRSSAVCEALDCLKSRTTTKFVRISNIQISNKFNVQISVAVAQVAPSRIYDPA
ncbi:MAG: hypothetical protein DRI57_33190 [Deltaproteobacteria bacterium]|nr:MAG: hypothetical protein DRI57_33190 [Deltaproteobacteria bacterium]